MSIVNIKFDLVEVTWDDASSLEHGWVDPNDEKPQPQLVKTVGFLVNESEHYLVIASTTDGNWVNGRFQIPKGMVRSCKPLRRKRKTKGAGLARAPGAAQGELPVAEAPAAAAAPNAAQPMEPKPAEPAGGKASPTVLEDLLTKAGEAASAMKKANDAARNTLAEPEIPRAA
ncbi:MAG: hypothetical protein JWN73_2702 [Betaproteobacteria bacterium]|nr:hypothetical protein [Betaproteobacteria bacterium]